MNRLEGLDDLLSTLLPARLPSVIPGRRGALLVLIIRIGGAVRMVTIEVHLRLLQCVLFCSFQLYVRGLKQRAGISYQHERHVTYADTAECHLARRSDLILRVLSKRVVSREVDVRFMPVSAAIRAGALASRCPRSCSLTARFSALDANLESQSNMTLSMSLCMSDSHFQGRHRLCRTSSPLYIGGIDWTTEIQRMRV